MIFDEDRIIYRLEKVFIQLFHFADTDDFNIEFFALISFCGNLVSRCRMIEEIVFGNNDLFKSQFFGFSNSC